MQSSTGTPGKLRATGLRTLDQPEDGGETLASRYWWLLPAGAIVAAAAISVPFILRGPEETPTRSQADLSAVLEGIRSRDEAKREAALAELRDEEVASRVTELVQTADVTTPERMTALELAAHSDGPEVAGALEEAAASDGSPAVRAAAVSALGKKSDGRLATFVGAAKDPDRGVRRAAVYALSQRDGREALEALVARLEDGDPLVRKVAANALRKKTSKEFGFRYFAPRAEREKAVEKWKEWLAGRL